VAGHLTAVVPTFWLHDGMLELVDTGLDYAARSRQLRRAARALLQGGFVSAWRGEDLDVRPAPGAAPLGCIDRCAVRVLGITTYSVHLNGYTADGRLVVGRRAAHKRVDPGLWDNLAGGMIAAGEPVHSALAREAFEEAGVRIEALPVHQGAHIAVRRPIPEGTLSEIVHVFDVDLPPGTHVANQDGEVECFETRPVADVLAAIARDEFTIESSLATLDSLQRRGYAASAVPHAG
jgi:8-oxo-dGTP pyrophosphatase MutT (NUDIX family)